MRNVAILPCAGKARRLGGIQPKELHFVGGAPLIDYSLGQIVRAGIDNVALIANQDHIETVAYVMRWALAHSKHLDVLNQQDFSNAVIELPAAMLSAWPVLADCDRVSLLMPDTICSPPDALFQLQAERDALSIGVFTVRSTCYGMVQLSSDLRILEIVDKPHVWPENSMLCWGMFSWTQSKVDMLAALKYHGPTVTDALAWLIAQGVDYGVHLFQGYVDVATKEDLITVGQVARERRWLKEKPPETSGLSSVAL
jgi:dTDP-glucose pyrophosphorylase